MILRLVRRSLLRRPGRSLLLLLGYGLGVGVTLALLSIGDALLLQSRDRRLLGGGDLTVLPAGIDLETLRTGGVTSLFFTVDEAPYRYREILRGPRFAGRVIAAAPWMENELLYLRMPRTAPADSPVAVSAEGRIPGLSARLGVRPSLVAGGFEDLPADSAWASPSDSLRLAEIDRFHRPAGPAARDSTWAEWHYFNVLLPGGRRWLYLTYLAGGRVGGGRWGSRVLAAVQDADGRLRSFAADYPAARSHFSTERPDLAFGPSWVRLTADGRYRVHAEVPSGPGGPDPGDTLRVDFALRPDPHRYLPPLEISPDSLPSGYVVPVLSGEAFGQLCVGSSCRSLVAARGYHDHNWGVWRGVTWDWGEARTGPYSLLYGSVRRGGAPSGRRFLFVADSLGPLGFLPIDSITYARSPDASGAVRVDGFTLRAGTAGAEAAELRVKVETSRRTRRGAPGPGGAGDELFHQMQGSARFSATLLGRRSEAAGEGFFETWTP